MRKLRLTAAFLVLLAIAIPGARAATFTVMNTADSGAGSLRQAILDANGNGNAPTVDLIDFAVPGAGVHTITFGTAGPAITEPVTIDATTQPSTTTLPLIELTPAAVGLTAFYVASNAVTIRGFVINGFTTGVYAWSGGHANVLGNFIGTDATGTQSPNAANQGTGVFVDDVSTAQVGGLAVGDGNVIASHGIGVHFPIGNGSVAGSTVAGNFIGIDRGLTTPLGNGTGVRIASDLGGVSVTGNVIAHSTSAGGVQVTLPFGNPILDNSFYANLPRGIDLVGPLANRQQPAPALLTATTDGLATRITGTQTIPPAEAIRVQLFSNPVAEQQGRTFVGEIPTLAAGAFDVTFAVGSTPGHFANGTATRPATNDTSEFSGDVQITAAPLLAKTFVPSSIVVGSVASLRITLTNLGAPAMTGLSVTDTYPPGLVNANPAAAATTCGGVPVFGAVPGGGSFSAGGLTVPSNGSCEVSVNVTAQPGSYPNTVPAGNVTSSAGPSLSPASATLEVLGLQPAPGVTKSFSPDTIPPGGFSTLTITLTNAGGTPITGVAFTDTYPVGLVNSAAPGVATTCGAGIAAATPGGNSLALSGGTIPANGSCTVSATVTASTPGNYVNDLAAGAVTSDNAASSDGTGDSAALGVAGILEVPALGSASLALLAALLAGGALLALRRR